MARRLPGFRFEAQPPPVEEALPRMDIAAFVGFAASGPLHCPVPIEDPAQFAAIFGEDATLAWDAQRGAWATAHLAPAVRAFLRNGGRRCWVVRVADRATALPDTFPLAGMLEASADGHGGLALRPALGWARSEGSWADGVRMATAITAEVQVVQTVELGTEEGRLALQVAGELRLGDLLRIHYPDAGLTAFMPVEQVTYVAPARSADDRRRSENREVPVYGGRAAWFAAPAIDSPPAGYTAITWYAGLIPQTAPVLSAGPVSTEDPATLRVSAAVAMSDAPPPGSMVSLQPAAGAAGQHPTWMMVRDVQLDTAGSPLESSVLITGPAFAWLPAQTALPAGLPLCERLSLDLAANTGAGAPFALRLADLDFVPAGPRYWGALPTDAELFTPEEGPETGPEVRARRETYGDLWRQAGAPRFPLAGSDPRLAPDAIAGAAAAGQGPIFTLPLGLAAPGRVASPEQPRLGMQATAPTGAALARDGLARFSRDLFLDEDLRDALTTELSGRADDIRYIAPVTRTLHGIHAVMAVDEVTILAVPDAVHRPWQPAEGAVPLAPADLLPLPRPEWWHFRGCDPQIDLVSQPAWGNFLDCALRIIDPPALHLDAVDRWGTVVLSWNNPVAPSGGASVDAPPRYVLEEATQPDFSDAYVLYEGEDASRTLFGRSAGDYYYHVRAVLGSNTSDWSPGIVAHVAPEGGWRIPAPPRRSQTAFDLLSIQRAMLRLCAARGDVFAILTLPEAYREDEAMAHVALIPPSDAPVFRTDAQMLDLPLSFGERPVLSYGAVYHPWLTGREENGQLRRTPPDGAVCGILARRALARGAWIAPANELLTGPVALTPVIDRARWLDLQEAQINVVRQEPHGFLTLSTDTLSPDPDLLQINVRRLLQLLRRLALRLGTGFVFEPQDDAFRRLVRRDVESVLRDLFVRGAFSGPTAETSYQVLFRSTAQDEENGRFIVDIRVAPSLPMTFLTVRLVQSGSRTTVSEER